MVRLAFAQLLVMVLLLPPALARGQERPGVADLLVQFERTPVFWQQFGVAERIVEAADRSVLKQLEPWLTVEDRHLRGNAAYVFARLGDPRGFEALRFMLMDYSYRTEGQGIRGFTRPASWLARQIKADRYYGVHLFGKLKDRRAVDVLTPLLSDEEISHKVAWALGEIGDRRAIPALISALRDPDALVRVSAIHALVKLDATEALPHLHAMLGDEAMPNAGPRAAVGESANAAIAALQKKP